MFQLIIIKQNMIFRQIIDIHIFLCRFFLVLKSYILYQFMDHIYATFFSVPCYCFKSSYCIVFYFEHSTFTLLLHIMSFIERML